MTETAAFMFRTYQFVYKWHDRYQKYGLKGLEERFCSGRPPLVCSHTIDADGKNIYRNRKP
ncbi:MAG: hypothetical protein K8823_1278 [Cenarchaeum symbiont of Oopsacas minuta]|nr:hypothetical protein [Cenarchaeum symbiont of Oopsacas minuta]